MSRKLKCIVCGYTEISDYPPERCPVCRAESDRFNAISFSPEWLDVEPIIDAIHILDSTNISAFEKPLSSIKLSAENLTLQPGETVDDFSLEHDSILLVLEGETAVSSDNPIKRLEKDNSGHLENSSEQEAVNQEENNSNSEDLEPDLFSEDASDDVKEVLESASSGTPSLSSSEYSVGKHQAIFLPGSIGLSIKNNGKSQLIILIVY